MFKKKPTIKPLAPIRSSDRRKIAQQIITDLSVKPPASSLDQEPPSESALRNALLPESTQAAKFTTTAGPDLDTVHGTIYVGAHPDDVLRPLWVKIDGEALFPTVYTLWKNPGLLPILHTHPPVIEKLQNGADLMVPGMVPPFPEQAKKGSLVGIASRERPGVPVCVGVCEIDVAGIEKVVGERGRAVRMVHWVGDEIFNHGGHGGSIPEALTVPEEMVAEVTEGFDSVKIGDDVKMDTNGGADHGEEGFRELSTKEIEDAFHNAALYGIHDYSTNDKISTLSFPLSSSAFISNLVLPYLPPASNFPPHNLLQNKSPHPSLQLKKTSWKNAAKFLKHLEKEVLVKTKTRGGGEIVVQDINWGSQDVAGFTPYKLPEIPKEDNKPAAGSANGEKAGTLKIVELYRPSGRAVKFFEEVGAGTKDLYTPAELKAILSNYIDSTALAQSKNKRMVQMNVALASLYPPNAPELSNEFHKRDELANRLIASCSPYYKFIYPSGEESKPKAGAPPRVNVVMEKRQGKKTVTRCWGLEPFGVDPKQLSEELARVCAGSASTSQAVGAKAGVMEILVQGSQQKAVEKALEKRGVASRFISVVDKTGGKK